jgi:hypothetical protein
MCYIHRLERDLMLAKYTIDYSAKFRGHSPTYQYHGDDPVACEQFLLELLERGFQIKGIRHEGIDLPKTDFDRMVKTAAAMLASQSICAALGISPEEEHFRFGFAA